MHSIINKLLRREIPVEVQETEVDKLVRENRQLWKMLLRASLYLKRLPPQHRSPELEQDIEEAMYDDEIRNIFG